MTRTQLLNRVNHTKADFERLIRLLPDKPTNARQRKLAKLHGTPRKFAKDVVACLGDISLLEAHVAIAKYFLEWESAK